MECGHEVVFEYHELSQCRAEIERNIGVMYDPVVAELALKHWEEITAVYRK